MSVEDFFDKIFCQLTNEQRVYFCVTKRRHDSIYPEDGRIWFCTERQELGNTGEWYSILYMVGEYSRYAIVTNNTDKVTANHVATCIAHCSSYDMSAQSEIYVKLQLNSIVERSSDLSFINRRIFGDEEEHSIDLEIRDGIAIGYGKDRGLVVTYPTLDRLTQEDVESLRKYCGLPRTEHITPRDVCLKFGRLTRID